MKKKKLTKKERVLAMYDPLYEERKQFIEMAKEHRKKVTKSKKAALEFLVRAGILTPKGNFRKPYRSLKNWNPK